MSRYDPGTLILAVISGTVGYYVYTLTGVLQALGCLIASGWILFGLRSYGKAWSSIGSFKNPFLFAVNSFGACFLYLSLRGSSLSQTLSLSLGLGLIGAVISSLLYKYWNIGS